MKYLSMACLALFLGTPTWAAITENEMFELQAQWAKLQYATPDKQEQEQGFAKLAAEAEKLAAQNPTAPEPVVWKGIALASQAQLHNDITGITLAEQARDILQRSLTMQPNAMQNVASITLGALYSKVPGWPLGFGDDARAREILQKAVATDPNSTAAHYFYGDFLYQKKQYVEAAEALQKAIDAPRQPGSLLADQGRREDARLILAKIKRRL